MIKNVQNVWRNTWHRGDKNSYGNVGQKGKVRLLEISKAQAPNQPSLGMLGVRQKLNSWITKLFRKSHLSNRTLRDQTLTTAG